MQRPWGGSTESKGPSGWDNASKGERRGSEVEEDEVKPLKTTLRISVFTLGDVQRSS